MSSYESDRQENIKRNQALIRELGLKTEAETQSRVKPPPKKRRRVSPIAASRKSARIASVPKATYASPPPEPAPANGRGRKTRKEIPGRERKQTDAASASTPSPPPEDLETLVAGWTSWQPVGLPPERDESGTLHFESQPSFTPNKTPAEVLREGAFGGCYYRPYRSLKLKIVVTDDWKELPDDWLDGLDVPKFLTGGEAGELDPGVNKFAVKAGQSLEDWEKAGWMDHRYDVRGWFQWYTRFYMGRRCEDDERQVGRWQRCVGNKGRFRRTLLKQYLQRGVRSVNDEEGGEGGEGGEVSPIISQTCLQWAYEIKQEELDDIWANGI